MDWQRILNPWSEIRRLEIANAALTQKCDDLWERAEYAEEKAFRRASEHYYQRSRMVEEQLRATQEHMANLVNLEPRSFTIPASFLKETAG